MTLNLKFKQHYKAYLLVGYAFLLIVHFVLKDYIFPLSIVFYAFPLPILIVIALSFTLLFFRRKHYRLVVMITTVLLTFIWWNNYYFTTEIEQHPTSKLLYWNLAKRSQLPVAYLSQKVNQYQPEILAFVEAPHTTLKNLDDLKHRLPNYNFKTLDGAMLIATKGDIELLDFNLKEDSYKINLLRIKTNTLNFKLIITDLTANVFVNKDAPLGVVLNTAKTNDIDLIVGDFNTPYESIFFDNYEENFTSFHSYNNGFTATWPLGMPLFEIDHIWIANKHEPLVLNKYYSDASDHALLICKFTIDSK